jgi:hypothetical protein
MRRETKRWILWVGKLVTLVVYLVFLAYAIIVGIAFVLQLLGANPTADFADWIYRAAENITQPFRGIFPTTQVTDRSSFNASWLFALIVYLIVAVILHGIIDWLTRRIAGIDRAEEREQQMAAIEAQRESTRSALGLDQTAVPVQPAPVPTTATTVDPWAVPAGQTPPPPPQPSEAYPPQSGETGYPPSA